MTPEQLLRTYFRAKDENRPHLLVDVFSGDAQLDVIDRSGQTRFPAVTVGAEGIADVLVRRFNQSYENIYTFCLGKPLPAADVFSCDWLVGMTEKASRNVRVGCGRYEWTLRGRPGLLVTRLVITIEEMLTLAPACKSEVMAALHGLDYPWISAQRLTHALSLGALGPVRAYIGRELNRANSARTQGT
jgi:hypothetical protein